jgi:hypothetical protein
VGNPREPRTCVACLFWYGNAGGAPRRGSRSRPPAVILLLHRDRRAGSRCAVLRLSADQVLLKVHVANVYSSVSDISEVCCKCFIWMLRSRSECCICCNTYTCILQVSIQDILSVFSEVCCKCVYLDVAYVSHICYKCLIWMLHMFSNDFSSVFMFFCYCLRLMFQVFHLSLNV